MECTSRIARLPHAFPQVLPRDGPNAAPQGLRLQQVLGGLQGVAALNLHLVTLKATRPHGFLPLFGD